MKNIRKDVLRRGAMAGVLGILLAAVPAGYTLEASSIWSSQVTTESVSFDPNALYAGNSAIHTGQAVLYHAAASNGHTVAVNAGHGTAGGSGYQTLSHPDGSPKVTGGTNAMGAVYSLAISGGTVMNDGTTEAAVNLRQAIILRDILVQRGYDVLMLRDGEDVQLDNVARTVMANQNAEVHVALHIDGTDSDKGFFYIGVPQISSYLSMEPVASHYQEHEALGQAILGGVAAAGLPVYGEGRMEIDLTQTSYSTIPSVDLELGDTVTDVSEEWQLQMGEAIANGLDTYFSLYQG